jgi:Raf kinase inhibitor-like YbhB/YbcL family protein
MKSLSLLLFLFLGIIHGNTYAADFTLESSAFKPNSMIPDQYTCSGVDTSPPLSWQNIPTNTQSLALVVKDPDAQDGEWIHWIVFNIPPTVTKLDAASPLLMEHRMERTVGVQQIIKAHVRLSEHTVMYLPCMLWIIC